MNPAEVVVHAVKGNRRNMALDFLRERIGEPSETAHRHAHGEVLAFDIAGADVLLVWAASDNLGFAADARRGAVALLPFGIIPVHLNQHGVVDIGAEPIRNGGKVYLVAVRRKLDAVCQAARKVLNKLQVN